MNHEQLTAESDFVGRDGLSMPGVGFGTYTIPPDAVEEAVETALELGYRHIDTAADYGNEEGVGRAIQKHLARGASRDELFVTTKLWPGNSEWDQEPKTFESTISACRSSLEKLQLPDVDLYLIHAPFHPEQRVEQWRALVELKKQGLVRAIGVSNFAVRHIEELRGAGLPLPAANQLELHPWSQKPELVELPASAGHPADRLQQLAAALDLAVGAGPTEPEDERDGDASREFELSIEAVGQQVWGLRGAGAVAVGAAEWFRSAAEEHSTRPDPSELRPVRVRDRAGRHA